MAFILPDLKRWFRKKDRSLPDDLFDLVEEDHIIPHQTIAADFPGAMKNKQNNTLFEEISPDEKISTAQTEEETVPPFPGEQLFSEPVSAFDRPSFSQYETFSTKTSLADEPDGNTVFSASRRFSAAQEKSLPLRAGRSPLPVSFPAVSSPSPMSGSPGEELPRPERKNTPPQEGALFSANNENLSLIAQCSRKMLKFLRKNNDLLKQNGQNQFYL